MRLLEPTSIIESPNSATGIVGLFPLYQDVIVCTDQIVYLLHSKDILFSVTDSFFLCSDILLNFAPNSSSSGTLVLGHSDGSISLVTLPQKSFLRDTSPVKTRLNSLKELRLKNVHQGAVTAICSSPDGLSFLSGGEDGQVRLWSKSGDGRSVVLSLPSPVTSLSFCKYENGVFAAASGSFITIKSISSSRTSRIAVTKNNAQLEFSFQSSLTYLSCISWHPCLPIIACVGSGDQIVLYDHAGKVVTSSFLPSRDSNWVDWSRDGEMIVVSGYEYVVLMDKIGSTVGFYMTFDDLSSSKAITTLSRVLIDYSVQKPSRILAGSYTGLVVDLPLISDDVMVGQNDQNSELLTKIGVDAYSERSIIKNRDQHVVIVDCHDMHTIKIFEQSSTKKAIKPYRHSTPIIDLSISPFFGHDHVTSFPLLITFVDSNRDLFILPVGATSSIKIAAQVTSFMYNENFPLLAIIKDHQLSLFPYPALILTDESLMAISAIDIQTTTSDSHRSIPPSIVSFTDSFLTLKHASTSLSAVVDVVVAFPLEILELYSAGLKKNFPGIVRLVRCSGVKSLWTMVAGLAINSAKLAIAEIAYAELGMFDKVSFLKKIRTIPNSEARKAELYLFRNKVEKAEKVLLSSGLKFRAIELNLRVHNWEKALELAITLKTHIDTVLGTRKKYLETHGLKETLEKFVEYGKVTTIDYTLIEQKDCHGERKGETESNVKYSNKFFCNFFFWNFYLLQFSTKTLELKTT
ncbi:hypothetical protein RCL1_008362 [Eukaryota sp. TZLM3-RCL]